MGDLSQIRPGSDMTQQKLLTQSVTLVIFLHLILNTKPSEYTQGLCCTHLPFICMFKKCCNLFVVVFCIISEQAFIHLNLDRDIMGHTGSNVQKFCDSVNNVEFQCVYHYLYGQVMQM